LPGSLIRSPKFWFETLAPMVVVLTGYNRNSKFDLVANAPGPAIFLQVATAADNPAIRSFFRTRLVLTRSTSQATRITHRWVQV